jgi:hypothetical protein
MEAGRERLDEEGRGRGGGRDWTRTGWDGEKKGERSMREKRRWRTSSLQKAVMSNPGRGWCRSQ